MAKLNAAVRALAIRDIQAGTLSSSELLKKYNISASALSYLRKMATGSTPALLAFEEEIGPYAPERIKRLYQKCSVTVQELAQDYECSTQMMKAWIAKHCPKPTTTKRISVTQATGRQPKRKR